MGRSVVLKIVIGVCIGACACLSLGLSACGPQFDGAGVESDGAAEAVDAVVGEPVLYDVDYSSDAMWERYLSEEGSYKIPEGVFGVVLPHHLITALELTRFYRGLSEVVDPRVIVILSPNHYEAGEVVVQTCNCSYKTFDGVDLRTSSEDLVRVLGSGVASLANENFEIEHGIYAHANFIKRFFPEAEILPLIIKKETSRDELDRLVEFFEAELGDGASDGGGDGEGLGGAGASGDVFFIASVDFAHYMTKEVSDGYDEVSFATISGATAPGFDYESLWDLELDSPGAIYVLSRLALEAGAEKVDLIEHTNSQDYFYYKNLAETTSHLYITFSKGT